MKWAEVPGAPENHSPIHSSLAEKMNAAFSPEEPDGIDLTSVRNSRPSGFGTPKANKSLAGTPSKISLPATPSISSQNTNLDGYLPSCEQYQGLYDQFNTVVACLPDYLRVKST